MKIVLSFKMKRVAFRCDANRVIGSGHFMRSLKLASYLKAEGCHVIFIMSSSNDFIKSKLDENSIPIEVLGGKEDKLDASDYSTWLPLGVNLDSAKTGEILRRHVVDTLVIDHYGIDRSWQEKHDHVRVVVIDDLANRRHNCDLLVDANEYLEKLNRYKNLVTETTKLYVGSKYALLDQEIGRLRSFKSNEEGRRVFVCYGGADPTGETVKFLKALRSISKERSPLPFSFDVVAGPFNTRLGEIEELSSDVAEITLHVDPENLYSLMRGSFFAYGAGGTMTWRELH